MIDFNSLNWIVSTMDGKNAENVELIRKRRGNVFSFCLQNYGSSILHIREVTVFHGRMPYPPDTRFYGDGFNMLSQYRGSLKHVENFSYTDNAHYKLPQKPGFFTCYNVFLLNVPNEEWLLTGFVSCRRFANQIRFNSERFEFVLDVEGVPLNPGEVLELEDFFCEYGSSREKLFADFAREIEEKHPRLRYPDKITGWCSWYSYGMNVTEPDILENMSAMRQKLPALRFVQIDDGYQNRMGDWLIPNRSNFPNGVEELCLKINSAGCEPAIWVSPFIAEPESELFRQHPDWFITDESGMPLPSSRCSFGGWRASPWYMLDGTHPEALAYIRDVFRTMREKWACRYFKLDGTIWGCLPFGRLRDPRKTHVEAYRAGMKAVLEGAGKDAVILGCNAPMWPSLGLCNAMRIAEDINRSWRTIKNVARQCFFRNWQNNRLWINDPDCLLLQDLPIEIIGPNGITTGNDTGRLTPEERSFHKACILASGGMILSGDKLPEIQEESIRDIEKILSCYGSTAVFEDMEMNYTKSVLPEGILHFFFNWNDTGIMEHRLPEHSLPLSDFWSGDEVCETFAISIPPCSARVLLERR